jgi:hypothetical protein
MNYENTPRSFRVGDKVTVDSRKYPGVWTIVKINPKNLKLEQQGRRLDANPAFLTKAGDSPVAVAVDIPIYAPKYPGQVVKVNGREGYWVVIKDSYDTVNVARLGGNGGHSLRASPALLTTVTVEVKEV